MAYKSKINNVYVKMVSFYLIPFTRYSNNKIFTQILASKLKKVILHNFIEAIIL